jgi:hypothetical protein
MNQHEAMMKPDREFVRPECRVLDPVTRIAQQSHERLPDLVVSSADVLLTGPVRPNPLPGLVEHAPMQLSHVAFCK